MGAGAETMEPSIWTLWIVIIVILHDGNKPTYWTLPIYTGCLQTYKVMYIMTFFQESL